MRGDGGHLHAFRYIRSTTSTHRMARVDPTGGGLQLPLIIYIPYSICATRPRRSLPPGIQSTSRELYLVIWSFRSEVIGIIITVIRSGHSAPALHSTA